MRSYQIKLSEQEKTRLISRIEDDFSGAKSEHLSRLERFRRYQQKWENRVDPPRPGDERKPNNTVPLIQWQVFSKWARDLQSLLGDDAEITAKPTGPSDADKCVKVGRYMTSRMFDQMGILNPLAEFEFRRILFGRSFAYRPWYKREFDILENGQRKRVCDYEGPGFFPLEMDDLVVPGERGVNSIQDFSFVIRRYRETVDGLMRGDGTLYQGTKDREFLKRAIDFAKQGANDYTMGSDPVRTEREASEGVTLDGGNSAARRGIWVWEWYGYWRPLKKKRDAEQDDLEHRMPYEADWVVRYIPGMKEIVGVQDLLELYPKMRKRRPFCESSLIKDGSYWSKGFGALLEDLEDEATANSRLLQQAGEFSVGPVVFYRPGGGMSAKKLKLEPMTAIPVEDPTSINAVTFKSNLEFGVIKQQDVLAHSERLTGQSDQAMGRSIDRPNAPRTATGQIALIEQGNIRAWLDATVLKQDMEDIVSEFWELDSTFAPEADPGIWFRVTEEQAKGSAGFDVSKGGAYMTPKEFGGKFDFRLKFATSVWSREAAAAKMAGFYQAAMLNPLIATNPRALWTLTNRFAKSMGIEDFSSIVPEPPELDEPKKPDAEWNAMLEGDDQVHCHPNDHDDMHLMAHQKQLEEERQNPERDVQALFLLVRHIQEHGQQKRQKMLMQVLTNNLMNELANNNQQTGGLTLGGGIPLPVQNLQQQLGTLFQPEQPQPGMGQPGAQSGSPAPMPMQGQF